LKHSPLQHSHAGGHREPPHITGEGAWPPEIDPKTGGTAAASRTSATTPETARIVDSQEEVPTLAAAVAQSSARIGVALLKEKSM
jgi:hypothetical protein